jgi:N-acetylglutamate synthase
MHLIEQAAIRAWPAAHDDRVGNWLVRRDRGYTKRANAIYAWAGEDSRSLDWHLASGRRLHDEAGLPLILRETSFAPVPGLEEALRGQGMTPFDHTLVMTRSLDEADDVNPATRAGLDAWMRLYERFEGGTKGNQAIHREILDRIATDRLPAVLATKGRPVSIGLAVADGTLLGLFDIATDPAERGKGHGRQLIGGMMAWGRAAGCETAYLQVMASNLAAVRLYERLGFTEAYRYHYWAQR